MTNEKELEILRRVVGEIGPCPAGCAGGMQVYPKFQGQDGRCGFCCGAGVVSLIACRCGRPRRFDAEGWVEGVTFCCGRKECGEKMKDVRVKAKRVVEVHRVVPRHMALPPAADDRTGWWEMYTQGMED